MARLNKVPLGTAVYCYDRADRTTSVGTTSYTVNADGNLVARGSDTFGYDQANRLKTASVSGTSSTYVYDGDGKRTSKTVGATQTSYVYDVNASLPVLLDDGTHKYVWGLGLAFAVDNSGNPLVYHTDGLGSVRAITDASGSVVQTYQYDEYGNVVSSSGSITQPFQYTGEELDAETGFIYLRARYYDPASGRFTTRDLVPGFQGSPASHNRFAYADNNPAGFADPSGLAIPPNIIKPCAGGIKNDDTSDCTRDSVSVGLEIMGIANPMALGALGEKLAGIVKNTIRIESLTKTANYRIPDILNLDAKIIGDVKNVAYQANSSQLRDFVEYAKANGYTMILKVRVNTALSEPVQKLVDDGVITLERVIP